MTITLIQPQYPHGSIDGFEGSKRQTYLPGGLLNLGSRLMAAGLKVRFLDLNHDRLSGLEDADVIGITCLGHSYIPEVGRVIAQIRKLGYARTILVGGEGVARLSTTDFQAWFGGHGAIQIKNDSDLTNVLGIAKVPTQYESTMVPMLESLSTGQRSRYLTTEFPLWLSQGCQFICRFCSAQKGQEEQYRTLTSLRAEASYIVRELVRFGHQQFTVYITNLDALQTPEKLEASLKLIKEICNEHRVTPHIRCLATSKMAYRAIQADPELPHRLRGYGLGIIAFGADGASEEAWKRQNKRHNKLSELRSVVTAFQAADVTVELLMVFGFTTDTIKDLWAALQFSFSQAIGGAVIRPYLAKSRTPSAPETWEDGHPEVETFRQNAELLRRLDYAMMGSPETHPNRWQRYASNTAYLLLICALAPFGQCPTSPLMPVPEQGMLRLLAQVFNRLMPHDR